MNMRIDEFGLSLEASSPCTEIVLECAGFGENDRQNTIRIASMRRGSREGYKTYSTSSRARTRGTPRHQSGGGQETSTMPSTRRE